MYVVCLIGKNKQLKKKTFDVLVLSVVLGVLPCKCKGTRENVRKPPLLPLARETAGVRECGAT